MEFQGAEATVEILEDRVLKRREPKEYRNRELDERLRKERTDEELKNLERARKYGVNAPEAEKTSESELELEKIDGRPLKEKISEEPELLKDVGRNVAKMHSADVIHGDLTTSNVLHTGEKVYLIDFGLSNVSERIEDKAVDIHLLKQVLNTSHPEIAEKAWEEFVSGYSEYDESGKVLERLEEVESRGRYK